MNCEADTECIGERADGNNGAGVNKNKRVRAASRFFLHSLFLKPSQDRHHSLLFVLSHVVYCAFPVVAMFLLVFNR